MKNPQNIPEEAVKMASEMPCLLVYLALDLNIV